MDIKSLEACFQNAPEMPTNVEEYEILVKMSATLKPNIVCKEENSSENLLTDDLLKTLDYLSKEQGIYLTANIILDWFVFYLFSRRYHSCDGDASVASMNFNKPWRNAFVVDDEKFAGRLNVPADALISWLETRPFVKQNLQMYSSAIRLAQSHPISRKHLVSHALRWTIRAMKRNNLDFTTGSPLALGRGGSLDSLSVGGDLQPISDEGMSEGGDSDSTTKWFATVIESNGALSEQGPGKKPVQLLRLAIEELILTCITDQLDKIRNMAFKRLQAFFKKAPLPISAVFCLRWIEISHQTPATNWTQQESLLKLIRIVVDKIQEEPAREEISGSQLLKQRLSIVFSNALSKKSPDESPTLNGRGRLQVTPSEEEKIKKVLLPKVRNLTLGMISNPRIPIRELAVSIYTTCVAMMHPENQAKILENALATLDQDISNRLDEIANNAPSNRPKLSQNLVESLTILCSKIAEMPNKNYCQVDWLQVALLCETMLSHPSHRVRDASVELLVAIFKIHKGSVQMARAIMVILTQVWTSRQEVLFKPFNQLPRLSEFDPEYEDKARECRTAWRSGHLVAFIKISHMLLAEYRLNCNVSLKVKKSVLSTLFDPTGIHRFSLNTNKPISFFKSRSSDIYGAAPLLLRLKQLELSELRQVVWNVRSATSPKNSFPTSFDTHSGDQSCLLGSDSASTISYSGFSSAASMNINSSLPSNCCFRSCLTVALHAAIECSCDPDRTIRYLAVQTLSEVAQVIGVFDHTLLTNIIMTHMSFEPTLLTYGCLEVLLNILVNLKSGKIGSTNVRLASTEPTSQLSPNLLSSLFSIERSRVWLRSCAHYIASRETSDAVTLNSVQVVMCALTSVHQLGPLSVRLAQMRMDALTEGPEETDEGENGYEDEKDDSKDRDQGFEDDSKGFFCPGDGSHLDLDIDALVIAIDSLIAVIQRLSTVHSTRDKESDSFGWLPESPTRRRRNVNGVVYTASNDEIFLEFTYLLLRRIEIPLQAYLCCNSRHSLSHVPYHLQPMNVETVAMALSNLVAPLAFLAFELYMEKFVRRREESIIESASAVYIDALREKCMITTINLIGLITQCLPKTPVLGIDINHDFTEPGTFSQRAMNRLESQVNSSAHVKETCDKFINILHDIFNFARRNLYPKSFLQCSHWWWIGQLCSCLPNLCQASPGQVDTSRLVELLCNEISTLRSNNKPQRNSIADSLADRSRDNRSRSQHQTSMLQYSPINQLAQLNWMRVKHISMAVTAFQNASKGAQQTSMEQGNEQYRERSDSGASEVETCSESASASSGCDCDDSKTSKDKARLGSDSKETSCLSRHDFPPLSIEETSILVAKLIKCSDARTIEPLQNIIPRDIVCRVRRMIEEEQRS